MFVHSRLKAVAVFTPPALPGFFAIPTAIPARLSFAVLLFTVVRHTQWRFSRSPKNCLTAWLAPVHCVLLDAVCDPGMVSKFSSLATLLLLPASSPRALAHPDSEHNGANYQIQRLTLRLATFVDSVFLQPP